MRHTSYGFILTTQFSRSYFASFYTVFHFATYYGCSYRTGGSLPPAESMLTVSTHYRVEMALGRGLEPTIAGLKGRRAYLCTNRAYIRPCLRHKASGKPLMFVRKVYWSRNTSLRCSRRTTHCSLRPKWR